MSGRKRPSSVSTEGCSTKSQCATIPESSATRLRVISPHRPLTLGARRALTRFPVSCCNRWRCLSSLRQQIFLFMQAFHSLVASRLGDRNLRAEVCDGPEPGQHSAEEEAGHQAEGESCHVHHLNPCLTRVRALCVWLSRKGYGNPSRSSRKQEGHPIC